uniref:Protein shisa-5 n=1 Tax=Syphacia muris TaxID=451379 RepID=A0A0N5AIN4_9BILA
MRDYPTADILTVVLASVVGFLMLILTLLCIMQMQQKNDLFNQISQSMPFASQIPGSSVTYRVPPPTIASSYPTPSAGYQSYATTYAVI